MENIKNNTGEIDVEFLVNAVPIENTIQISYHSLAGKVSSEIQLPMNAKPVEVIAAMQGQIQDIQRAVNKTLTAEKITSARKRIRRSKDLTMMDLYQHNQ